MYPTCQMVQEFAGILLHYCRDSVLFLNREGHFQLSSDLSDLASEVFALRQDCSPQMQIEEEYINAKDSFTNGHYLIENHEGCDVETIKLEIMKHFMDCVCSLMGMYVVSKDIASACNYLNNKIIALPTSPKLNSPISTTTQNKKTDLIILLGKINQNRFPLAKRLIQQIDSSSKDFDGINFALLQSCANNELKQKQHRNGIMYLLQQIEKYLL